MVSKHPPIGEGFIVPWEVKASPKTACSNFGEFLKIGVWCAKTLMASVSHIFDSDSEEEEFLAFQRTILQEQIYLVKVIFLLMKEATKVPLKTRKATAVRLKAEVKKIGATILSLLLLKILTNPPGLQLFFQPQQLLATFKT